MSYFVPAHTVTAEEHIKGSRFIAYVTHAASQHDVALALKAAATLFPNASHYCYAFIIGKPGHTTTIGMSDAGEPKGTAGKPIFTVLEHSHIGDIVAVVVRYFGGTLLGTGGLSRAYSSVVQSALHNLPTQQKIDVQQLRIEIPYTFESNARYLITEHSGTIVHSVYQATLLFEIALPREQAESFINKLIYQSNHEARITEN